MTPEAPSRVCGKCQFFGIAIKDGMADCYANPPVVAPLRQEYVGGVSWHCARPEVHEFSKACRFYVRAEEV